jgi:hypothetical protein
MCVQIDTSRSIGDQSIRKMYFVNPVLRPKTNWTDYLEPWVPETLVKEAFTSLQDIAQVGSRSRKMLVLNAKVW